MMEPQLNTGTIGTISPSEPLHYTAMGPFQWKSLTLALIDLDNLELAKDIDILRPICQITFGPYSLESPLPEFSDEKHSKTWTLSLLVHLPFVENLTDQAVIIEIYNITQNQRSFLGHCEFDCGSLWNVNDIACRFSGCLNIRPKGIMRIDASLSRESINAPSIQKLPSVLETVEHYTVPFSLYDKTFNKYPKNLQQRYSQYINNREDTLTSENSESLLGAEIMQEPSYHVGDRQRHHPTLSPDAIETAVAGPRNICYNPTYTRAKLPYNSTLDNNMTPVTSEGWRSAGTISGLSHTPVKPTPKVNNEMNRQSRSGSIRGNTSGKTFSSNQKTIPNTPGYFELEYSEDLYAPIDLNGSNEIILDDPIIMESFHNNAIESIENTTFSLKENCGKKPGFIRLFLISFISDTDENNKPITDKIQGDVFLGDEAKGRFTAFETSKNCYNIDMVSLLNYSYEPEIRFKIQYKKRNETEHYNGRSSSIQQLHGCIALVNMMDAERHLIKGKLPLYEIKENNNDVKIFGYLEIGLEIIIKPFPALWMSQEAFNSISMDISVRRSRRTSIPTSLSQESSRRYFKSLVITLRPTILLPTGKCPKDKRCRSLTFKISVGTSNALKSKLEFLEGGATTWDSCQYFFPYINEPSLKLAARRTPEDNNFSNNGLLGLWRFNLINALDKIPDTDQPEYAITMQDALTIRDPADGNSICSLDVDILFSYNEPLKLSVTTLKNPPKPPKPVLPTLPLGSAFDTFKVIEPKEIETSDTTTTILPELNTKNMDLIVYVESATVLLSKDQAAQPGPSSLFVTGVSSQDEDDTTVFDLNNYLTSLDIYATIFLGDEKHVKTKAIKQTNNPRFHTKCVFPSISTENPMDLLKQLTCKLFDRNSMYPQQYPLSPISVTKPLNETIESVTVIDSDDSTLSYCLDSSHSGHRSFGLNLQAFEYDNVANETIIPLVMPMFCPKTHLQNGELRLVLEFKNAMEEEKQQSSHPFQERLGKEERAAYATASKRLRQLIDKWIETIPPPPPTPSPSTPLTSSPNNIESREIISDTASTSTLNPCGAIIVTTTLNKTIFERLKAPCMEVQLGNSGIRCYPRRSLLTGFSNRKTSKPDPRIMRKRPNGSLNLDLEPDEDDNVELSFVLPFAMNSYFFIRFLDDKRPCGSECEAVSFVSPSCFEESLAKRTPPDFPDALEIKKLASNHKNTFLSKTTPLCKFDMLLPFVEMSTLVKTSTTKLRDNSFSDLLNIATFCLPVRFELVCNSVDDLQKILSKERKLASSILFPNENRKHNNTGSAFWREGVLEEQHELKWLSLTVNTTSDLP